jgi:orotate phosphoribosyltransferase
MTTLKRTQEIAAARAIADRTEALFRGSGALRSGHFVLKSGRHSDAYLEKFQVLQDPAATSELCGLFAAPWRGADDARSPRADEVPSQRADDVPSQRADDVPSPRADEVPLRRTDGLAVNLVAGPTTGGVILAFETGRQLGTRAIFAEEVATEDGGPRREFRRGFTIHPGERVLLVDDILTTGGSLLAMIPAVEAAGGEIVECAVLVDRSGGMGTLTSPKTGRRYPLRALWQLELETWEPGPGSCPRCAAGEPAVKPGSSGTGIGPA